MKDETHKNFICTFHQSSGYFHSLSSLLRTLLRAGYYTLLYFFFLFCIGVQLINNAVIVSGEHWRDPAMYVCMYVSIPPQTLLPSRLPHNIEQSSMCCVVGPRWLSVLNIAVTPCFLHLLQQVNKDCHLPSCETGETLILLLEREEKGITQSRDLGICFIYYVILCIAEKLLALPIIRHTLWHMLRLGDRHKASQKKIWSWENFRL